VVIAAEHVIDKGDVDVEFPGVLGLKLSVLEFDDNVPELLDVEEEQIDVVVIAINVEVNLTAHERKARPQLPNVSVIRLVRAFSRSRSATTPESPRNSKLWGSSAICWASSESAAASCRVKIHGAAPVRYMERFISMFSSTFAVMYYRLRYDRPFLSGKAAASSCRPPDDPARRASDLLALRLPHRRRRASSPFPGTDVNALSWYVR
jgi:hypothetical protein